MVSLHLRDATLIADHGIVAFRTYFRRRAVILDRLSPTGLRIKGRLKGLPHFVTVVSALHVYTADMHAYGARGSVIKIHLTLLRYARDKLCKTVYPITHLVFLTKRGIENLRSGRV
jgi:hypothetical protein